MYFLARFVDLYVRRSAKLIHRQIVLGSIATKPQMALAPSALSHLESAYNLFSQVTDQARKAKILVSLK